MKKLILSAAIFAAFTASASAEEAAPASPHTFTGNVTVATDYRFRGISQTFKEPTIQGGFDYSHSSGFYLGNWNSNVSNKVINDGSIEMDFYGGYKFEPVKDVTADVGALQYYYPGAKVGGSDTKYNTTEVYLGASYKWFAGKYSYAVSNDVFGVKDARGSWYLDLNGNFEIADKTTLNVHVGRQKIDSNAVNASYTDWKIGVSRDFGFATVGLAYVDTNASDFYTTGGRELGKATAVLSVSKTF